MAEHVSEGAALDFGIQQHKNLLPISAGKGGVYQLGFQTLWDAGNRFSGEGGSLAALSGSLMAD